MNYITYTFKPGVSLFLALVSIVCIIIMGALYIVDNPLLFILTVIFYFSIVGAVLLGNFLRWLHYRETAPRVRVWNENKGEMEDRIA